MYGCIPFLKSLDRLLISWIHSNATRIDSFNTQVSQSTLLTFHTPHFPHPALRTLRFPLNRRKNRNQSENYHHLSLNSKQKIKQRARCASVRALFLPWTGVDFIITTILHISPFFFDGSANYAQDMSPQGQIYSPEEATTGTIESPSQNSAASSSAELVELSGPSSSISSAQERRV